MNSSQKTIQKYKKLAENPKHIWRKGEILGLKKLLNSASYVSDLETKRQICDLARFVQEEMKPARISPEQTKFGIAWLKSQLYKSNGERSNSKTSRELDPIAPLMKRFREFRFAGFDCPRSSYAGSCQFGSPIYVVISKRGERVEYSHEHWGSTTVGTGYMCRSYPYITSDEVKRASEKARIEAGSSTLDECNHNECDSTCQKEVGDLEKAPKEVEEARQPFKAVLNSSDTQDPMWVPAPDMEKAKAWLMKQKPGSESDTADVEELDVKTGKILKKHRFKAKAGSWEPIVEAKTKLDDRADELLAAFEKKIGIDKAVADEIGETEIGDVSWRFGGREVSASTPDGLTFIWDVNSYGDRHSYMLFDIVDGDGKSVSEAVMNEQLRVVPQFDQAKLEAAIKDHNSKVDHKNQAYKMLVQYVALKKHKDAAARVSMEDLEGIEVPLSIKSKLESVTEGVVNE